MQRGQKQTAAVMDVSPDLFDTLIESRAPFASRLSAANDGLAPVNRTNAPVAHLTEKKEKESAVSTAAVPDGARAPLSCALFA